MQHAMPRRCPAAQRFAPLSPHERRMQRVVQVVIAASMSGMLVFFHVPLMHEMGLMLS